MLLIELVEQVGRDDWKDGRPMGASWKLVEAAAKTRNVLTGRKEESMRERYSRIVANLEKHLPAAEFESLAGDKLKENGSRLSSWLQDDTVLLVELVKQVEQEGRKLKLLTGARQSGREHYDHFLPKNAEAMPLGKGCFIVVPRPGGLLAGNLGVRKAAALA